MRLALHHWRKSMSEPITFAVILLAAAMCMISGPFGTLQAFSPVFRLLYWFPIILLGGAVSLFIRIVLRLRYPHVAKIWIEIATVVGFTAVFGVPLVLWSAYVMDAANAPRTLPSQGLQLLYLAIVCAACLWLRTFVITVVCNRAAEQFDLDALLEANMPRLGKRMSLGDDDQIYYIMADDHFVEVHTSVGVKRLRMRFKDAIAEMDGVEGYCAHRSYWVCAEAVVKAEKTGSNWRLDLVNGEDIPVSRKCQPELETAGLLRA